MNQWWLQIGFFGLRRVVFVCAVLLVDVCVWKILQLGFVMCCNAFTCDTVKSRFALLIVMGGCGG